MVATPLPGYTFSEGREQVVYSGDLGTHAACVEVEPPVRVAGADACGYEHWQFSEDDPANVRLDVSESPVGTVKFTATAADGYAFSDLSRTREWVKTGVSLLECATPEAPTCVEGPDLIPPAIGYTFTGVPQGEGEFSVTAHPNDGYHFPAGAQTSWTVPGCAPPG